MAHLKIFAAALALFLAFDWTWFTFVTRKFNLEQLAEIGRIKDGAFDIWLAPAIGVYILMALLMTFFVRPLVADGSWLVAVGYGALMGFCLYGVFDLTNAAILKNYPIPFAIVDVAWGTASFAVISLILSKI